MGAEYKDLINIKEVIDHDTGMYQMGEIECCYTDSELEKFLKSYGVKGRDDLMNSITHLIHNIEACFRSLPEQIRFPGCGQAQVDNRKMPSNSSSVAANSWT